MSPDRLRVVVAGYVVRFPVGGNAWAYLNYALGFSDLGHEVAFLETSEDYPSCYDPVRGVVDRDPTYGLGFMGAACAAVGLGDRWAYHDDHNGTWHGPFAGGMEDFCRTADLVVNVSAANSLDPWCCGVPHRVFVDTDPAFEQIRQLTVPRRRERASEHNHFLTFAENIDSPGCAIPDDGIGWRPTRQPVALKHWPVAPGRPDADFTSVMQWKSYKPREFDGRTYGLKSDSFGAFVDLPARVGPRFTLALGSEDAPRSELEAAGWHLVDPLVVTRDLAAYQRFIRDSRAEFAVAKHGYVVSRSGWFSERSAGYLASGRPVLAQDTGFGSALPTGEGLIAFSDVVEAAAGVEAISARYEHHCRAARAVAEEHFASSGVLTRLLESL